MAAAKKGYSSRLSGNKSGKRRLLSLVIILTAGILMLVAASIADYAQNPMPNSSADYALVLGAKSRGNSPLPVYQSRIDYALQLYRDGKVKKILFTGGPNAPETLSQSVVGKQYAMERGIPESDILIEEHSMRTLENFREAVKVLPNPKTTTILVVSDPYHLKRAMLMAQDVGFNAEPAPVPQTLVRSYWNRIKFLCRETVAYIYYWVFRR